MQYNTIQYNTMQYNTTQYSTTQQSLTDRQQKLTEELMSVPSTLTHANIQSNNENMKTRSETVQTSCAYSDNKPVVID